MADITVKLPNLANQTAIVNALNKIAQQTLDVRSLVSQAVKDNWKTIYPVGSVYISINATSPASLFGGSWEQIQDRFLLAAGSTYSAGSTGGSATHRHRYGLHAWMYYAAVLENQGLSDVPILPHSYDTGASDWNIHSYSTANGRVNNNATASTKTINGAKGNWVEGNTAYESSLPPYFAVYMWKRVS